MSPSEFWQHPDNKAFEALVGELEKLMVSKSRIAKALEVSACHVSRILGGERHATARHLEALTNLLKATRSEIVRDHIVNNPLELLLVSTCSALAIDAGTHEQIIEEGRKLMADKEHRVSLPEGIAGAVLEHGKGGYLVIIDQRFPPHVQQRIMKHEFDSLLSRLSREDDEDDVATINVSHLMVEDADEETPPARAPRRGRRKPS